MKRRGFLGLLGLAPAVPLIAKELAKPPEAPLDGEITLHSLAPKEPVTVRYEGPVSFAHMATAGYVTTLRAVPHSPGVWRLK